MSKFRDFEFRGDPDVYINREIQEVPVHCVYHGWENFTDFYIQMNCFKERH